MFYFSLVRFISFFLFFLTELIPHVALVLSLSRLSLVSSSAPAGQHERDGGDGERTLDPGQELHRADASGSESRGRPAVVAHQAADRCRQGTVHMVTHDIYFDACFGDLRNVMCILVTQDI
jgi:hypothetical protein